jgi:large-conductance mechanosensitive channel
VVTPRRGRVVAAKVGVSVVIGAAFGLVTSAFAAGVGIAVLRARGIDMHLDAGDYLLERARMRIGRLGWD